MLRRPPQPRAPDPAEQVHRISSAPTSHSSDQDSRVTRYLISMGIRTVCVVLVVVVPGPLRWVFGVGAVVLPYVAVLLANAGGRPRDGAFAGPGTRRVAALPGAVQARETGPNDNPVHRSDD